MKKTIFIAVLIMSVCLVLTACTAAEADVDGKTKVVFELEGGVYKNSDRPVTYYFGFAEGSLNLIKDMFVTQSGYALEKTGYEVEGWYRSRSENPDGTVAYDGKWNFATDRVGAEGVTLYAKWQPQIKYSYRIYYKNAEGADVPVGEPYYVSAGAKFNDMLKYASNKKPAGTTFLKFVDGTGADWDTAFAHPGGDADCEIKVYASYIEGDWAVVRTANELRLNKSKNIYLMNDINLGGAAFSFGDYSALFNGNGHTVKNFSIAYDPSKNGLKEDYEDDSKSSLYISIFGVLDGATVENVVFSDVKAEVKTTYSNTYKIYLAPVCNRAINSTVKNVFVTDFEYVYTRTPWTGNASPDPTDAERYFPTLDRAYGVKDESSSFENCPVSLKAE
ncbi:MAG: hypothetical protein ACI4SK_06310 [Christensenellales bacterium]